MITADNLKMRFGEKVVLDSVSFKIEEGQVYGLLGPNGAGKTTTMRILSCILRPAGGSASVCGHEVLAEPEKIKRCVGLLTENPCLYMRLSVFENLDFYGKLYSIKEPERSSKIRELLQFFELDESRNNPVRTLSKGMKKKLSIARALLHNPPVLLLDEPTSDLDPKAGKALRELIEKMCSDYHVTVLLCTHNLTDVEALCSQIGILVGGQIRLTGNVQEIKKDLTPSAVAEIGLSRVNSHILESLKERCEKVDVEGNTLRIEFLGENYEKEIPAAVREIVMAGGEIISVKRVLKSLEDVYLGLVSDYES